jgi:hypothetical protein
MSTIKVDTIKNTSNVEVYTAKAWVNFDGTWTSGDPIRADGNVSSITDNGTGKYTISFTTAMPDTSYSCNVTGNRYDFPTDGANFQPWAHTFASGGVQITNGIPTTGTGSQVDASIVSVVIFR